MNTFTTRDFASLLDDMLSSDRADEFVSAARPSLPFDFLTPEHQAPSSDPLAAAEYLFAAADSFQIEPDLPPVPEPPSIAPFDIGRELRLTGRERPEILDRIRREFAFANHPDRVAEDMRERAIVRMQIANRMIDDAKDSWQQQIAAR